MKNKKKKVISIQVENAKLEEKHLERENFMMIKLIFLFCASYRNNFLFLKDVANQNQGFQNIELQVKLCFLSVQSFSVVGSS